MSSSEYLSTSFIGGWVTVLAVAGAMGYQYYSKSQPAAKKEKATVAANIPKKQNRAKKQRQEAFTAQKATAVETPAAVTTPSANSKKERDEESDNKAFAAQMANVKAGKKFDGKSNADKKQKQKSVKQSRAAEPLETKAEPEVEAAPASPEVEAADLDSSSAAASPEVAAADPSGVSDMLEPTSSGPSVLRLTDTDKVKQKAKVTKAPEQVETKKQRQNRKKAEERKLAREEDEKERKALMEKQRRTAREAAGVPAKDGSQFTNAAVKSSAWTAGATNGTTPKKEETLDVQPLDTFESTKTDAPAASIAPAKQQPKDTSAWTTSLPSEEEQLEAAKAEDDAWATVPTKGSKKAKKTQSSENLVPSAPAKEARPAPAPLPVNGNSKKPTASYGSFSALTVDKTTAQDDDEDVEETEWDV